MAGSSVGEQRTSSTNNNITSGSGNTSVQQQLQDVASCSSSSSSRNNSCGGDNCCGGKLVWRRRQTEHPSTEDALRALLNKLAPSRVLGCLASKVAGHLIEDEAPDQLARQLVERVQAETMFASTYAKLCSELVRVRGGFVFYKHLMTRCRATFSAGVRQLIIEPEPCGHPPPRELPQQQLLLPPQQQQQLQQQLQKRHGSVRDPIADACRHRLKALSVFVCHLFLEGLLSFDQLHQDHLQQLESQLPDPVAIECICSALVVAGHRLEEQRPHWLQDVLRQLQDAAPALRQERNLRLSFMVRDLVELHQRNWQQRELQLPSSPIEHAEP